MRLTLSNENDRFMRGNESFFYLADTVWSVFSNTSLEDWQIYLEYRKAQQFNVLQISILPILHDTSDTYIGLYPFEVKEDGKWNYHHINEAFFQKAEKMVEMAVEQGFLCALVVLWANYVPDTVHTNMDQVMPFDAVKPYAEYVANRFKKYSPIYLISGDTDLSSKQPVAYYKSALEAVKSVDPEALTTLHVRDQFTLREEEFIHHKDLDFYMYQSGHLKEEQHCCYTLAEEHAKLPIKRPIVNGEPCYEGHGHGLKYARYDEFDVRKAFWWSVLSGGKAGFTYGAHGLFSWHQKGAAFTSETWSKIPFDWRTALRLQGGWDVSHCKWLYEKYELFDIEPTNNHLITPYKEIRMAATPDLSKFAIYIPYTNDVLIDIDLSDYDIDMIELTGKQVIRPTVEVNKKASTIKMHDFNSDVVVFGKWRS